MVVPGNFTLFNEEFLEFKVTPGEELKRGENKSIAAWSIVDFTESEMKIQVNFSNPMIMSQSVVSQRTIRFFLYRIKIDFL